MFVLDAGSTTYVYTGYRTYLSENYLKYFGNSDFSPPTSSSPSFVVQDSSLAWRIGGYLRKMRKQNKKKRSKYLESLVREDMVYTQEVKVKIAMAKKKHSTEISVC